MRRAILLLGIFLTSCSLNAKEMAKIPGGVYRPLFRGTDTQTILVKPFLLDSTQVTVREFRSFLRHHPEWGPQRRGTLFADKGYLKSLDTVSLRHDAPITEVSWFAARAYCRSLGKRLPSAAEWEFAALAGREALSEAESSEILGWYSAPTGELPSVGQRQNSYGVFDLHGSIWEWVSDFNSEIMTGESRSDGDIESNLFCGAGALQASEKSRSDYAAFMRYAFRGSLLGHYTVRNLGFRCAQDVEDSTPRTIGNATESP